jgi:hypothetical protein
MSFDKLLDLFSENSDSNQSHTTSTTLTNKKEIMPNTLEESADRTNVAEFDEHNWVAINGTKYSHKGERYSLIVSGVCTHCAHCGQPLTDAESSQRGIGPICSRKGYTDEVEPVDPLDAMIALSQYPQLVDYLNAKYKPQGNRGLANGLVRTASLNRRTPVHAACTDALDALGYKKLASALRESLAVVEIYDSKAQADAYGVWVKKTDFDWNFYRALTALQGVRMTKYPVKEIVVPKVHRRVLAQMILKYYEGLCVKTKGGAHKISPEWFGKSGGSAS